MMNRKVRTLHESKEIINPIYSELVNCIESGFYDYLKVKEFVNKMPIYVEFKPRTKAGIIHDFIRANITKSFSDDDMIDVGDFNRVFGLNIDNKLFVRFKKMDSAFKVSSFQTKQHKKYIGQQQIEGFPKEPTFLIAGYIPNQSWTSLDGIYLACWNGSFLEWFDEAGNYSYEQLSLDFETGKENIQKIVEKRVRLKKGLSRNKETGTDNN